MNIYKEASVIYHCMVFILYKDKGGDLYYSLLYDNHRDRTKRKSRHVLYNGIMVNNYIQSKRYTKPKLILEYPIDENDLIDLIITDMQGILGIKTYREQWVRFGHSYTQAKPPIFKEMQSWLEKEETYTEMIYEGHLPIVSPFYTIRLHREQFQRIKHAGTELGFKWVPEKQIYFLDHEKLHPSGCRLMQFAIQFIHFRRRPYLQTYITLSES